MKDINQFTVTGRVTRVNAIGDKGLNVGIAQNQNYMKDGAEVERTMYLTLTIWNRPGLGIKDGDFVTATGQIGTYKNKDGKYETGLTVDQIFFLNTAGGSSKQSAPTPAPQKSQLSEYKENGVTLYYNQKPLLTDGTKVFYETPQGGQKEVSTAMMPVLRNKQDQHAPKPIDADADLDSLFVA